MRTGAVIIVALFALLLAGAAHGITVKVRLYLYVASVDGYVTVSPPASEVTCGRGFCVLEVTRGQILTLTAGVRANSRTSFVGWGGGCSGRQRTCVVAALQTPNGLAQSVRASFSRLRVWADVRGGGYIEMERAGTACGRGCTEYAYGTNVRARAIALPGFKFGAWGGDCGAVKVPACVFSMLDNRSVSARFDSVDKGSGALPARPSVVFSLSVTGGQIVGKGFRCTGMCKASAPRGNLVTASANIGAPDWGGACGGHAPTCIFVNSKDDQGRGPRITATFAG